MIDKLVKSNFKPGDKIIDGDGYPGTIISIPTGKMKGCLFVQYPKCQIHVLIKGCKKVK